MIDARTGRRRAISAQEASRELTDELQRFNAANADRGSVIARRHGQQTVELPAKEPRV
jgi:hypothetical protein